MFHLGSSTLGSGIFLASLGPQVFISSKQSQTCGGVTRNNFCFEPLSIENKKRRAGGGSLLDCYFVLEYKVHKDNTIGTTLMRSLAHLTFVTFKECERS